MSRALVVLADGAEEIEVVVVVDALRRAGVDVVLAALEGDRPVRCSRGVVIVPDVALASITDEVDLVVLPGGADGVARLAASSELGALLGVHEARGGLIGAICAAPAALAAHHVHHGAALVAHPSVHDRLTEYLVGDAPVARDGRLVTAEGAGASFPFALALLEALGLADRIGALREAMRLRDPGPSEAAPRPLPS